MEPGGLRTLSVTKNAAKFLGKTLASTLKNISVSQMSPQQIPF